MRIRLFVLVVAACLGVTAAARAHTGGPGASEPLAAAETAIFYYPWFGTAARDGAYTHWQQGGNSPPQQIASDYYPVRGPYSSADSLVLAAQMREIADAGVSTVIVSWWGRGSVEDQRLPRVLAVAQLHGLAVAVHVEPYGGRTVGSVATDIGYLRSLGIVDFYIWASTWLDDGDWAEDEREPERDPGLRQHEPGRQGCRGRLRRPLHLRRASLRRWPLSTAVRTGAATPASLRTVGWARLRRSARDRGHSSQVASPRGDL